MAAVSLLTASKMMTAMVSRTPSRFDTETYIVLLQLKAPLHADQLVPYVERCAALRREAGVLDDLPEVRPTRRFRRGRERAGRAQLMGSPGTAATRRPARCHPARSASTRLASHPHSPSARRSCRARG